MKILTTSTETANCSVFAKLTTPTRRMAVDTQNPETMRKGSNGSVIDLKKLAESGAGKW